MNDPAQTLLFLVIFVLTVLIIVLGIQVFLILRDLRVTISKANKVLDDTGQITESVSAPITSIASIITGAKAGTVLANVMKKHGKRLKEDKEEEDE